MLDKKLSLRLLRFFSAGRKRAAGGSVDSTGLWRSVVRRSMDTSLWSITEWTTTPITTKPHWNYTTQRCHAQTHNVPFFTFRRVNWNSVLTFVSFPQTFEQRQVTHFQFLSWPDYGVPSSAVSLIDFLGAVKHQQQWAVQALGSQWRGHPLGPPMVVHCSAGIGRTG